MFTGLIEQVGILQSRSAASQRICIKPARRFDNLEHGESIAVNGCCLTVERELPDGSVEFFTLAETLRRTNLGSLPPGSPVNLERALQLGKRLGGHIVSGHVDGTGEVLSCRRDKSGDLVFAIALTPDMVPEVVAKGSIAVDGISLTVVEAGNGHFTVHLIPVTQNDTALTSRKAGSIVNLETDILGKYVRRQLAAIAGGSSKNKSEITMQTLADAGFL